MRKYRKGDIVKYKGEIFNKHMSLPEQDVFKLRARTIPLTVGEEYEVYSRNMDNDIALECDKIKPNKLCFPHSFFELVKESELPEEESKTVSAEVMFVGGNWEDKKRRAEEAYKRNPYQTTLPEYKKIIDENTEKARNMKGR